MSWARGCVYETEAEPVDDRRSGPVLTPSSGETDLDRLRWLVGDGECEGDLGRVVPLGSLEDDLHGKEDAAVDAFGGGDLSGGLGFQAAFLAGGSFTSGSFTGICFEMFSLCREG